MKILVDADSCPVKEIIVEIARQFKIDVFMFIDTSHVYQDFYSTVITVDKGRDSVDFELIKYLKPNDIVITQDYGLACMALAKKAFVLNQNGLIYTKDNIDSLLLNRYISYKERKATNRIRGPKKRSMDNNNDFKKSLLSIIDKRLNIKE